MSGQLADEVGVRRCVCVCMMDGRCIMGERGRKAKGETSGDGEDGELAL